MSTFEISSQQFDDLIQTNDIVLIDFWAHWCAPCKQFATIYEEAAKQYPAIKFAKVNIEKETELANQLHILSIPHLMIFKQGILIYSEAGSMPESMLNELLQQALAADVSEIREKIDKNEL